MPGVVVVRRVPGGVLVVDDELDLVDEQAAPALARIGVEAACAGLPADLVAEDHGFLVFPAEGVGADDSLAAVVGDGDGPVLAEGGRQRRPGWGEGGVGADEHGAVPVLGLIANLAMLVAIVYLYIIGNSDSQSEAYICFVISGAWALISAVYVLVKSRTTGRSILAAPRAAGGEMSRS